jgi:ACS family hexuronate transporter-like MFS transporter
VKSRPESLRWWILLLLFLAMTINFLDRQVLSLVAPVLSQQLHLSNTHYGTIVFCFMLGMTVGQIPAGMLLDRWGARFGFSFILALWSVANMAHVLARSMFSLSALRFVLGLGECGTYSGGVKVIGQWFPARSRALAAGLFNSGSLIGAIIAPPVIVYLTVHYGWTTAFLIPSSIGLLWIVPWLKIYRPPESSAAAPVEHMAIPQLLAMPAVWGVILMRTFGGPVTHFYWYWLPKYLNSERHMSLTEIGMFAWMPFFCGGLGNIGGGWFSSWLIRRNWSVNRARKTAFVLAAGLCLFALLVPAAPNAAAAMACLCLAALGINAFAANLMGLITDLFPQPVLARVSSLTGVGDGAMSMCMMCLTGVIVDRFSYLPIFMGAGLFPMLSLASLLILVGRIRPIPLEEIYGPKPPHATVP